jgi:hypothetical protein
MKLQKELNVNFIKKKLSEINKMTMNNLYTEKLFSYGTLRYEDVQLATFGRKLNGLCDALNGYTLSQLKISDPTVIATSGEAVHPILIATNNLTDKVDGIVFDVSVNELELADKYEVSDYKRVSVCLCSGLRAWVYVSVADA